MTLQEIWKRKQYILLLYKHCNFFEVFPHGLQWLFFKAQIIYLKQIAILKTKKKWEGVVPGKVDVRERNEPAFV